jgi:hypothetical protein
MDDEASSVGEVRGSSQNHKKEKEKENNNKETKKVYDIKYM